VMMRHYSSIKREVLIDECAGCGGIWLNAGELERIRGEFSSSQERERATQEYLSSVFEPKAADSRSRRKPGRNKDQGLDERYFTDQSEE
jgi:uncharacterized protein